MRRCRALLSCLLPLLLAACGTSAESIEQARIELASNAALVVHDDLEGRIGRLARALDEAEASLAAAEPTPSGRFVALERLREETGVDGLLWEGPGGEEAWAGRALDPMSFPPPPPWEGSFRRGLFALHDGPFLRALVAGPADVRGGALTATIVLEEVAPGADMSRAYESRWLVPLGVEKVELLPPDAARTRPAEEVSFLIRAPGGAPWLRGVVTPPDERAVADRLEQDARGRAGLLLLLAWGLATLALLRLVSRGIREGAVRLLSLGALLLFARTALGEIDLPGRFPFLRAAFDASDFGIQDPFGWLASPADLALTAGTFVLATTLFARAVYELPRLQSRTLRAVAPIAGVGLAAAASSLWVAVVELAVAQGQTEFFAVPSVIPELPAGLLLMGLVAATAAAWTLVVAGLTIAARAWPALGRLPLALVPVGAAAGLAMLLALDSGPTWAAPLLPIASLLVHVRRGARTRPEGASLPGRVLLVGVLATVLLFPLLWHRVGDRRAEALAAVVDDLLRVEPAAYGDVLFDFERLAADETLRTSLKAAREGPVPEGLGLEVWLHSSLARPGGQGFVSLLDAEGRILDEFTITPLRRDLVPQPTPPSAGAGDLQVVIVPGDGRGVRCVVGRLTLRTEDDEVLGHVVMTIPDAVDLALLGYEARGAGGPAAARDGAYPLQFALLEGGRVVASSDPSVSRRPDGLGPVALDALGPERTELAWQQDGEEGYAVWSWDRGATIAVRRRTAGLGDAVLALARLVVVGVGLACLIAVVLVFVKVRDFRWRLHHRILLSYFIISFIPLVALGWASARDARSRHDTFLSDRLETDIGRARSDLEELEHHLFDRAVDKRLVTWASLRGHDVLLYRDGYVLATSRPGLVEAEIIASRLPADAYRATVLEGREIVRREASFAGRPVWFGCAPVLDSAGRTVATVGVPLLYRRDAVQEGLAVTGSVLLAAWLITLVLVLVAGIWAARRLARPLGLLAAGTRRVAAGQLDVVLEPEGPDELGQLVGAFNRMTRDLADAQARAVTAERQIAWRRMARQVAHEIKNPLTPIRLMIQQMEADVARDPSRAVEAIRRTAPVVLRQIEALGRIASDFAHFARMPKRTLEDVDVGALGLDVANLYGGSAAEGILVRAEPAEDLPPVRGDPEEIRRVLLNLVGNAVQAIEGEGEVEVRIESARREAVDGLRITVCDTGVGILPEHMEKLFEPDFSTKPTGTGLGLAMVKRTIDDMGGAISVASPPGEGSTFTLWVPLRTG